MERKNNIFIFVAIGVFLVFLIVAGNPVLDKRSIPISFYLSENTGFGSIEGELLIGAITANQSGARAITISNTFDEKIKVTIESSGETTDQVIVSENNFELEPGESKDVTFTAYTAGLTEYREYRGNIIIISRRA